MEQTKWDVLVMYNEDETSMMEHPESTHGMSKDEALKKAQELTDTAFPEDVSVYVRNTVYNTFLTQDGEISYMDDDWKNPIESTTHLSLEEFDDLFDEHYQ